MQAVVAFAVSTVGTPPRLSVPNKFSYSHPVQTVSRLSETISSYSLRSCTSLRTYPVFKHQKTTLLQVVDFGCVKSRLVVCGDLY